MMMMMMMMMMMIGSILDDMVMRIPECAYQYLNPIHPVRGESLN